MFAPLIDWMIRHRSSMPAWVDGAMESAARNPDGLAGRLASRLLGGAGAGEVTRKPQTATRVYIAPTNYSGQGYRWARALEAADPAIGARNMAVSLPGGFDFPADTTVPIAVVNSSKQWGDAEWRAASSFTHVLVEAERSMFGRRFDRRLTDEIAALQDVGVSVALLSHGTDIRDPDRHAQLTTWSPYPEDPRTDRLREDARANLALLETLGLPVFVSTPDLLHDLPTATWCPVVVDAKAFSAAAEPFQRERIRVVHVSSSSVQKGSHLIEPALSSLIADGSVQYRLVQHVKAAAMPDVFADTDIVIDQFRIGSYGVAACEAMAAGRVVVGHVLPSVRDHIENTTGIPLPIVEATPDTLAETIERLRADPPRARGVAAAGPLYVEAVHTGNASARALIKTWIRPRS